MILNLLIFFIGLFFISLKTLNLIKISLLIYLSILSYKDLKKGEVENYLFLLFYPFFILLRWVCSFKASNLDFVFALIVELAFICAFYLPYFIKFFKEKTFIGGADVKAIFIPIYFLGIERSLRFLILSMSISLFVDIILKGLKDSKYKTLDYVPYLFCMQLAYVLGEIYEVIF